VIKLVDWPLFHGNNHQTGYTKDVGPSEGKLAWKFPVGRQWYSRPVVDNGKIYAVSPGERTMLYCLDKETGGTIWITTRPQDLEVFHGSPRMVSTPIVLKDKIVLRGTRARQLVYVDKNTGHVVKTVPVGYLDCRVNYRPLLAGNEDYLVYREGVRELAEPVFRRHPPPVYSTERIGCKEASSGKTLWGFRVGQFFCEPLLDGNKVYVGTYDGIFYCLNVEGTDRIVWQFKAGGSVNSSPTIWNSNVYFGANDGVVYCLDKGTGLLKWRYEVEEKEPRAFIFFSTPTVAEGKLLIGAANKELYCLDAETGKLAWRYVASDWIRSRPACQGKRVYVASMDGTVHCLSQNKEKVELEWKTKVGTHQIFSDLVLSDEKLFITSSDLYLWCLNVKNGDVLWKHSLLEVGPMERGRTTGREKVAGSDDYQCSPVVADGKVFIGTPTHFVYAVDTETGKEIWRFEVGGQIPGAAIYSNGRVLFGQKGGTEYFYCLDAKDGSLVWKQKVGWVWSSANVSEGRVFVPSNDFYAYCLREKDGAILWRYKAGRDMYSSPPIDEGKVYFGSWDGWHYCLDIETGNLIWKFYTVAGCDSGAPIAYDGHVYLPSFCPEFFCLDGKTGKVIWKFTAKQIHMFNATPALHGDYVFITGHKRAKATGELKTWVFCLDRNTGDLIWEHQGGGLTGPAVANGKVFFASWADPFFYCVDEKGNGDGTTRCLWKYEMGGVAIESCPAVAGGKVFILCGDGYLYAFR